MSQEGTRGGCILGWPNSPKLNCYQTRSFKITDSRAPPEPLGSGNSKRRTQYSTFKGTPGGLYGHCNFRYGIKTTQLLYIAFGFHGVSKQLCDFHYSRQF